MKAVKKYLITLLIGFATVAMILWSKGVFQLTEAVAIFHTLSDAFFVVGVVIFSAGALIFSSNEGTFDMLVYGMKTFLEMFKKQSIRKYDTFYDYRQSRVDKKVQFGFLLICGLVFLAIAFVMYYFYRQNS